MTHNSITYYKWSQTKNGSSYTITQYCAGFELTNAAFESEGFAEHCHDEGIDIEQLDELELLAEYAANSGDAEAALVTIEPVTNKQFTAGRWPSVDTLQALCPEGLLVVDSEDMVEEQLGWSDKEKRHAPDFEDNAYWLMLSKQRWCAVRCEPLGFDNVAELLELLS